MVLFKDIAVLVSLASLTSCNPIEGTPGDAVAQPGFGNLAVPLPSIQLDRLSSLDSPSKAAKKVSWDSEVEKQYDQSKAQEKQRHHSPPRPDQPDSQMQPNTPKKKEGGIATEQQVAMGETSNSKLAVREVIERGLSNLAERNPQGNGFVRTLGNIFNALNKRQDPALTTQSPDAPPAGMDAGNPAAATPAGPIGGPDAAPPAGGSPPSGAGPSPADPNSPPSADALGSPPPPAPDAAAAASQGPPPVPVAGSPSSPPAPAPDPAAAAVSGSPPPASAGSPSTPPPLPASGLDTAGNPSVAAAPVGQPGSPSPQLGVIGGGGKPPSHAHQNGPHHRNKNQKPGEHHHSHKLQNQGQQHHHHNQNKGPKQQEPVQKPAEPQPNNSPADGPAANAPPAPAPPPNAALAPPQAISIPQAPQAPPPNIAPPIPPIGAPLIGLGPMTPPPPMPILARNAGRRLSARGGNFHNQRKRSPESRNSRRKRAPVKTRQQSDNAAPSTVDQALGAMAQPLDASFGYKAAEAAPANGAVGFAPGNPPVSAPRLTYTEADRNSAAVSEQGEMAPKKVKGHKKSQKFKSLNAVGVASKIGGKKNKEPKVPENHSSRFEIDHEMVKMNRRNEEDRAYLRARNAYLQDEWVREQLAKRDAYAAPEPEAHAFAEPEPYLEDEWVMEQLAKRDAYAKPQPFAYAEPEPYPYAMADPEACPNPYACPESYHWTQ